MNNLHTSFLSTDSVSKNRIQILHLYNHNDQYHLTRQILLDSGLNKDNNNLFYNCVTLSPIDFNSMYESVACLILRSEFEADLYMNVSDPALTYVLNYVQTGKIDLDDNCLKDELILSKAKDLATMFGMPALVEKLSKIQPAPDSDSTEELVLKLKDCWIELYRNLNPNSEFSTEELRQSFDTIMANNKEISRLLEATNQDLVRDLFIVIKTLLTECQ